MICVWCIFRIQNRLASVMSWIFGIQSSCCLASWNQNHVTTREELYLRMIVSKVTRFISTKKKKKKKKIDRIRPGEGGGRSPILFSEFYPGSYALFIQKRLPLLIQTSSIFFLWMCKLWKWCRLFTGARSIFGRISEFQRIFFWPPSIFLFIIQLFAVQDSLRSQFGCRPFISSTAF